MVCGSELWEARVGRVEEPLDEAWLPLCDVRPSKLWRGPGKPSQAAAERILEVSIATSTGLGGPRRGLATLWGCRFPGQDDRFVSLHKLKNAFANAKARIPCNRKQFLKS